MSRGARILCAFLAAAVAVQPVLAADPVVITLKWAQIDRLVNGKQVTVTARDGSTRKGRVRAVDADGITFEDTRAPRVVRADVTEIRVTEYVGNGRRFGKMFGGLAGLMIGLPAAAVIGMREGSGKRTGDKVLIGVLGIGGLPLGILAGYLIGRQIDKEVTVIRIIPS